MPRDMKKLREFQRLWMRNRRAEFFAGKSCVKCGSTQSLELDHVDPSTKTSHNIWSWRKERRDAEIAKCQVLCRICHQEKTIHELGHRPNYLRRKSLEERSRHHRPGELPPRQPKERRLRINSWAEYLAQKKRA